MEFLKSFVIVAGVIFTVALLSSWQTQFPAIKVIAGSIVIAFNVGIFVVIFWPRK